MLVDPAPALFGEALLGTALYAVGLGVLAVTLFRLGMLRAMAANDALFLAFWVILFEAIDAPIRGYSFTDVAFLWSVAAAGFGLGAIVCGNAAQLSRIIYQGDLDVYLTQPKPVLPNLLASRMSVSSWGDLLYGVGLFAVTQPLTAVRVLYRSLTFLLGNAEDMAGVGSEQVVTFSLYPGSIFDGPLIAVVLHTLIPAALVAHLPAELFRSLARSAALDWGLPAAIIGGDAALIAAAWAAFYLGLRRYESGNRIGARI